MEITRVNFEMKGVAEMGLETGCLIAHHSTLGAFDRTCGSHVTGEALFLFMKWHKGKENCSSK